MCSPIVTRASGSAARIARGHPPEPAPARARGRAARRSSSARCRGPTPRAPGARRARPPPRGRAAPARAPISASVYQSRSPSATTLPAAHHPEPRVAPRPPQRPARDPVHPAHVAGEQRGHDARRPRLARRRPPRRAARASRGRPASGEGWKSSHSRKSRTESMPAAATRAKSRATSPGSKRDHQAMADASRPVVDPEAERSAGLSWHGHGVHRAVGSTMRRYSAR